jgi:hypothetical protein
LIDKVDTTSKRLAIIIIPGCLLNLSSSFLKLLDSNDPTSSKRFVGFCSLFTCIVAAIVAMCKNHGIMPDVFFNGLLMFTGGIFAVNGMENIFKGFF